MVIESLQDISTLLVQGFDDWGSHGRIYVRHSGDLSIFNYRQTAIYDNKWPFLERVSRGLIINNKTCRIVARPFDKFFNWNERGRTTEAAVELVTEKMDGSLGILYWQELTPHIATRGSFDSDQAIWATNYFRENLLPAWPVLRAPHLIEDFTLMFEIIYPENRVIVDYGDRETLVLIAARHKESGEYLSYKSMERLCELVEDHGGWLELVGRPVFGTGDEAIRVSDMVLSQQKLSEWEEGWVAFFEDGSIFKFKSHDYMALQKKIMGLSFKNTVKAVREGTHIDIELLIPEEFLGQYKTWVFNIKLRYLRIAQRVSDALAAAPQITRKEFAMWVLEKYPDISHIIFACVDGKGYEDKIFDKILKDGEHDN